MFDFLKPRIVLPANFLRTAFQAGTGLYKTDNRLPNEFCAAHLAAIATEDAFPTHSSALMAIDKKEELQAGYFQNETGGIIIYCHYDNPAFLDLNRRSSVIVVGELKAESLSKRDRDDYSFETFFAFLGHHHPEYLLPATINTFYDYDEKKPETILSLDIDTKSEESLAMAFCFADLCFKSVLANKPTSPKEAYQTADNYTSENLVSHFEQLKTRGLRTLESEVNIANNTPLKNYTAGPT